MRQFTLPHVERVEHETQDLVVDQQGDDHVLDSQHAHARARLEPLVVVVLVPEVCECPHLAVVAQEEEGTDDQLRQDERSHPGQAGREHELLLLLKHLAVLLLVQTQRFLVVLEGGLGLVRAELPCQILFDY